MSYIKIINEFNISPKKDKKIISFCLYGLNDIRNRQRHFDKGVYVNYYYMQKYHYRDWIMRIYMPHDEPSDIIENIKQFGDIELILVDSNVCLRSLRFLPNDDPNVSIWLSRDLDSIVNSREEKAVLEWLNKPEPEELIIMSDHEQHRWTMAGGMFGKKASQQSEKSDSVRDFIINYSQSHTMKYGSDCEVAESYFFRPDNYIQYYRAGKKLENSIPFPDLSAIHCGFVGNISPMLEYFARFKLRTVYPFLKTNLLGFNLDLHVSVISDFIDINYRLKTGLDIVNWSISNHTWVFNKPRHNVKIINENTWKDINLQKIKEFQRKYGNYLMQFDFFVATHTPVFCMLWEKYNKPIILINSCRYEQPFCWTNNMPMLQELNSSLKTLDQKKLLIPISNNLADQYHLKINTNISSMHIPSLCLYTNAKYNPQRDNFLVYDTNNIIPNFPNTTKVYKYKSWSEIYNYKGIIHMPYEISTMALAEQYSANIPLFMPSYEFLTSLLTQNKITFNGPYHKSHKQNAAWIKTWLDKADYYNEMKHIIYYSSFEQLEKLLEMSSSDLLSVSNKMKLYNKTRVNNYINLWRNSLMQIFPDNI